MTESIPTTLHDLILRTFATVESKHLDAMMSLFADDAVFIDPHFPTPTLREKAATRKGFQGALSGMRSFGYTIVTYCESENGKTAAVETATHHVLKQGMKRDFPRSSSLKWQTGLLRDCRPTSHTGHMGSWGCFCRWHAHGLRKEIFS